MNYNKILQATLSTAVVTALLVGCQPSDKQKTQIRRGGNSNGLNNDKLQTPLSQQAVGGEATTASVSDVEKIFTEIAQTGQNKEVLIENLEEGDYALTRAMYDAQDVTKSARMNLLLNVDGETVCAKTTTLGGATTPQTQSTNTLNTAAIKTRPAAATNIVICDYSKTSTASSLNSNPQQVAITGLRSVTSYLRFTVKNKAITLDPKNMATFRSGFDLTSRKIGMDIMPGDQGTSNIFALVTNPAVSNLKGSLYVLKDQSKENANIAIRKVNDNSGIQVLSVTFETKKTDGSRVDQFVFQYKKVSRTSESTTPTDGSTSTSTTATAAGPAPNVTDADSKTAGAVTAISAETESQKAASRISDSNSK